MDAENRDEDDTNIRPGENSRDRFRRLAEKRVIRTIKDVRLIGNLGNRNNYEYSEEDVEKIFRALERELKLARSKFDNRRKTQDEIDFSL